MGSCEVSITVKFSNDHGHVMELGLVVSIIVYVWAFGDFVFVINVFTCVMLSGAGDLWLP
jgi:hypothetical protein